MPRTKTDAIDTVIDDLQPGPQEPQVAASDTAPRPPIDEDQKRSVMKNDLSLPPDSVVPKVNFDDKAAPKAKAKAKAKAAKSLLELDTYYKFHYRDEKCVGKVIGFNENAAQVSMLRQGQPVNLREFPMAEMKEIEQINKVVAYNISINWNHYGDGVVNADQGKPTAAEAPEAPIQFEVGKTYTFAYRNRTKKAKVVEILNGGRTAIVDAEGADNHEVVEIGEATEIEKSK